MNEFNFNSYDTSRQSISYCEVDKCKAVNKLKQTLAEIKDIAEINKNYKFETKDVYAGDTVELKFDVLEQILQKINEVEDDKSNN